MTLKKYTTVAMAATMLASTVVPVSAASMDKLVGDNRYETAVMISYYASQYSCSSICSING